jgi:hypothetical protein
MWTRHKQQQQRGVQLPPRERQPGEAPREATRDRAAQDHDRAGGTAQPGDYPASAIENTRDAAPEAQVAWDAVVQPEQRRQPDEPKDWDDLPLPEGK